MLGYPLATESPAKGEVRTHPDVGLVESLAARKHAHKDVGELLGRGVLEGLLVDLYAREGFERPLLGEEVPKGAKTPEGGLPT